MNYGTEKKSYVNDFMPIWGHTKYLKEQYYHKLSGLGIKIDNLAFIPAE